MHTIGRMLVYFRPTFYSPINLPLLTKNFLLSFLPFFRSFIFFFFSRPEFTPRRKFNERIAIKRIIKPFPSPSPAPSETITR